MGVDYFGYLHLVSEKISVSLWIHTSHEKKKTALLSMKYRSNGNPCNGLL